MNNPQPGFNIPRFLNISNIEQQCHPIQCIVPWYPTSTSQIQSNAATGDVEGFDTGTGGTLGAIWPYSQTLKNNKQMCNVAADGPKKESMGCQHGISTAMS